VGEILAKWNSINPLSSVQEDSACRWRGRGKRGLIDAETTLIEPTSGNTGIALAFVCAAKGYKLILTMPESMSVERRKMLGLLGARLELTPAAKGMKGAISRAEELAKELPKALILQQFANPANPAAHRAGTAEEIWADTQGDVDILIGGVGTGGTLTGCGEALKAKKASLRVIGVEPEDSPVLSGGAPGPPGIQGIGAGFVPEVLNREVLDEVVQIATATALATARLTARIEGVPVGISSGAALAAAIEVGKRAENQGKKIVVIIPRVANADLSTALFDGCKNTLRGVADPSRSPHSFGFARSAIDVMRGRRFPLTAKTSKGTQPTPVRCRRSPRSLGTPHHGAFAEQTPLPRQVLVPMAAKDSARCCGEGLWSGAAAGARCCWYLAAAGGHLAIADDRVGWSNLQRQVLYDTATWAARSGVRGGAARRRSTRDEVGATRPRHSETFPSIAGRNCGGLLRQFRQPVPESTRLPAGGRTAVSAGTDSPGRWGAGQTPGGPCCAASTRAAPRGAGSRVCEETGILGAVAGMVGAAQALAAIKAILGLSDDAAGHVQIFDGLAGPAAG
jgi:cysteine synthase A